MPYSRCPSPISHKLYVTDIDYIHLCRKCAGKEPEEKLVELFPEYKKQSKTIKKK